MTSEYERIRAEDERFVEAFDRSSLTAAPLTGIAILACMHARIDVEDALGLRVGDAHIIRNAGGFATQDAVRSLVVSQQLLGTREVLVIAHTGCGLHPAQPSGAARHARPRDGLRGGDGSPAHGRNEARGHRKLRCPSELAADDIEPRPRGTGVARPRGDVDNCLVRRDITEHDAGGDVGAQRPGGRPRHHGGFIVRRVHFRSRRPSSVVLAIVASAILVVQSAFAAGPPSKADPGLQNALDRLNQRAPAYGLANHAPPSDPSGAPVSDGFEVVGHNALGGRDSSGDVWVHGDFAYVGTWRDPCSGRGVKIIDVSDPSAPRVIGAAAARRGTSAEDMVVRSVETPWFTGDLMAVGIQRCGRQGGPAGTYGAEFWDVTDPYHPARLAAFGITHGDGGAHELDLIQRGDHVYAALALPFSEWFDSVPVGDVAIVDVTDPRHPVLASEWGVADDSPPQPGPFYGLGSFGAAFGHSVRFSDDGNLLYASYWDRGAITLDISDVTAPVEVGATIYPAGQDGDLHSLTPYGSYLLTNDEDFDPRSPAEVWFDGAVQGYATEHPFVETALWDHPGHEVAGDVVLAANEGCDPGDYPADAEGAIVVVHTPIAFFEDAGALCAMPEQENMAEAAGASAVVHRFDSPDISPQWWDFSEATIPVLFTDVDTADGMVSAGSATVRALQPTWGFLRVFDAATGAQVSQFDGVPNINDLTEAGNGFWSIHNTEVSGSIAYSAWYSNGIVALDLDPITDIQRVGQFVPPGEPFAEVWGVFVGDDGLIYASDIGSGLWIIEPTFDD